MTGLRKFSSNVSGTACNYLPRREASPRTNVRTLPPPSFLFCLPFLLLFLCSASSPISRPFSAVLSLGGKLAHENGFMVVNRVLNLTDTPDIAPYRYHSCTLIHYRGSRDVSTFDGGRSLTISCIEKRTRVKPIFGNTVLGMVAIKVSFWVLPCVLRGRWFVRRSVVSVKSRLITGDWTLAANLDATTSICSSLFHNAGQVLCKRGAERLASTT